MDGYAATKRADLTGRPMSWLMRLGDGTGTSRLLCLPYAGGRVTVYEDWVKWLRPGIELWVPDLPGHGHRMLQEPVEDMDTLVGALADALAGDDRPVSLFGHSLGALVAFELARRLHERRLPLGCLVVSAMQAPPTLVPGPPPTDAEILADLRVNGAAPPRFFADTELLELAMPALRAEYGMAAAYRYRKGPPLTVPVYALGGRGDAEVTPASLAAWAHLTEAPAEVRMWDGGHMYLLECAEGVAAFVADRHLRATGG